MCGEVLPDYLANQSFIKHLPANSFAIKTPVMPFAKFPEADPLLGPEMRSTGEVMATGTYLEQSLIKSYLAAGLKLPQTGNLLVSLSDRDKEALLSAINNMYEAGFKIIATAGTHWFLKAHGINSIRVNKVREGSPHVLDLLDQNQVNIMFNIILGSTSVHDSHLFRKKALLKNIPYFTSVSAARAIAKALARPNNNDLLDVLSLQERHGLGQ